MTASRSCRACGADLSPDVPWCVRCYEPVRHLTPRDAPLPTLPLEEVVDPRTVRADFAPLRVQPREYSRTRGGPTSFGLLGRLAVTGVVIALLPWGMIGSLALVYLVGYLPVAFVVLRATWAATPVDPNEDVLLPPRRSRNVLRFGCGALGAAMSVAAAASGGSPFAVVPGLAMAVIAATPLWWGVLNGIAELRDRPLGLLVALNVLNVVDIVASDAAIRAGEAAELNPFVGATGSGVKIVLVLACSVLLYRVRPRALIWPTMAFVALTAYHLTGWLVMYE
jgi:hypothetical protein